MKRLTLKNSSNRYQFYNKRDYISGASLEFVGQVEDIFEKYGIESFEQLEGILSATVDKVAEENLYDGLTANEMLDVMKANMEEPITATASAVVEETVEEEPVIEKPKRARKKKVEEPVVEQPIAEEPVIETPVIEPPVDEDNTVIDEIISDIDDNGNKANNFNINDETNKLKYGYALNTKFQKQFTRKITLWSWH